MSKSFKSSCISLTIICSFFLFSTPAYAANLHAVLVGDTVDDSLGFAFKKNLMIMRNEAKNIAEKTGLTLNLIEIEGDDATRENVVDQLVDLDVQQDDVVILYFSNHGYRTESKETEWPNLYFNLSQDGMEFEFANEIIMQKNPRFFLSIADSCNNPTIPDNYIDTLKKMSRSFSLVDTSVTNYRKLFLETSGVIIISSSIPGQYSWAWPQQGGVFTMSFGSVMDAVNKGEFTGDWIDILDETGMRIALVLTFKGLTQTPQYSISLAE